jgi:hypothetical protein
MKTLDLKEEIAVVATVLTASTVAADAIAMTEVAETPKITSLATDAARKVTWREIALMKTLDLKEVVAVE